MKTKAKEVAVKVLYLLVAFVMVSSTTTLAADWVTTSHTVTVQVPEVLSISADTSAFSLAFSGYVKSGDESASKTVTYTVQSNNMRQADGAAAINANLDFLYDRIGLKADVGAYTKTSGNTELAETASGFVTIGTDNVTLANKANTTAGADGKMLNGTIPITYKAVATDDVPSGDQVHVLYVTLTTI